MKIKKSTKEDYAHIIWESHDELKDESTQESICLKIDLDALKGFKIEISETDNISEESRQNLEDGKFFLVD